MKSHCIIGIRPEINHYYIIIITSAHMIRSTSWSDVFLCVDKILTIFASRSPYYCSWTLSDIIKVTLTLEKREKISWKLGHLSRIWPLKFEIKVWHSGCCLHAAMRLYISEKREIKQVKYLTIETKIAFLVFNSFSLILWLFL